MAANDAKSKVVDEVEDDEVVFSVSIFHSYRDGA